MLGAERKTPHRQLPVALLFETRNLLLITTAPCTVTGTADPTWPGSLESVSCWMVTTFAGVGASDVEVPPVPVWDDVVAPPPVDPPSSRQPGRLDPRTIAPVSAAVPKKTIVLLVFMGSSEVLRKEGSRRA